MCISLSLQSKIVHLDKKMIQGRVKVAQAQEAGGQQLICAWWSALFPSHPSAAPLNAHSWVTHRWHSAHNALSRTCALACAYAGSDHDLLSAPGGAALAPAIARFVASHTR